MVHSSTDIAAVRLLVVERLRILRELLGDLLSSEHWIEVTSTVCNPQEANEVLNTFVPDVIVVGVPFVEGSCVEWMQQVKANCPNTKIIFLSSIDDEQLALEAINSGVNGFLAMNSSCISLVDAVRSVIAGDYVFGAAISQMLLRMAEGTVAQSHSKQKQANNLTVREQEIVDFVIQGYTNQEIAQRTFVSVNTVKTHLRRIYQRLCVSSRRELMQVFRTA